MITIIKNYSKAFHYSVFYGERFLGDLIEDDIVRFLGKDTKKFYKEKQSRFLVSTKKIKSIINKTKYI
tara:strand:+ start:318 stop:521 length:204 start_codon:yes stop_codon:yes gene_type:complete